MDFISIFTFFGVYFGSFLIGFILWLIYGILKKDLPLILANSVTLVFSGTILFLKLKYK